MEVRTFKGDMKTRRKQRKLIFILCASICFIGFALYKGQGKVHSYLHGSVYSRWYNSELAKITKEGYKLCSMQNREGFCKTPCWNGTPYQEPRFLLTPNCMEYSSRQVLVYVYSALENHRRRQMTRNVFRESMQKESEVTASLVFVVGSPTNQSRDVYTVIEKEHRMYGDIMQISIPDIYTNLAYKALAVFKWIQHCGVRTQYLVKLDDDSLENENMATIFSVVKTMNKEDKAVQNSIVCLYTLYGLEVYEPKIQQHWESTFHQYYSAKFPTFCGGQCGTFMTRQVALSLYEAAKGLPVYHVDDTYITGILRERACIAITDWGGFFRLILLIVNRIMIYFGELQYYEFILKDIDRQTIR